MASNKNALVQFEVGVTSYPMAEITDSGDHKTYNTSAVLFSSDSGEGYNYEPKIMVNGILTGGIITPTPTTNNSVTVSTISANLAGVETTVVGAAVAIARPATNVARVISITVTSAGALAAVVGTDGTNTTFSEVRGAAGAPPYIPVGSIEIGQVRVSTSAAAVVSANEIFQVDGTHMETAGFPIAKANNFTGKITFNSALPLIHTGDLPKKVYASYSSPVFIDQPFANDFVPVEKSTSVSSEQVYGDTIGTSSDSLGQGSFTAILKDGITDPIIAKKGKNLMFRFYQDKAKPAHILTQGILGLGRTFNASDSPRVNATISAQTESVEKAS